MNTAASNIEGMQLFRTIDTAHSLNSLFGIPLIMTEKAKTLGTTGDLGLYDFSQYIVGIRKAFELEYTPYYRFRNYETSFRVIVRIDGQPGWPQQLTLKDSSVVSPFVVLGSI
jgi:HK97 family phage major capsid protein